jgi:hypothetical protein
MRVTEQLQTTEWEMIGSLGNDSITGVIPTHHRLQASAEALASAPAYNLRIRDAALKTQNYDKGLDSFVRKFDPEKEMSATMALCRGHHSDNRWSAYITLRKRGCCLLDTTYGLSDEEALPVE